MKGVFRMRIDLHAHTTASDGSLTPRELVHLAKSEDLSAIAITDHDTMDGVEEGLNEGEKCGVEVVPGLEISVKFSGEMHILGYYVDRNCEELREALKRLQQYRRERNPRIIQKLQELGLDITMAEAEQAAGGNVVGRPHIAQVLVNKGYTATPDEAFDKYLEEGKPAYVSKEKLTPAEGIRLIARAKGIPVLAHPKSLGLTEWELDQLIESLKCEGLMGIEVYYSTHSEEETALYLKLARKHQLLLTGGSDFHGAPKPEIRLGKGLGDLQVCEYLLEELKKVR